MDTIPDPLAQALRGSRYKAVPKNQMLLYEGDITHDVFVIKSGIVKMHDIDEQGNDKILHLFGCPSLFPLAFFSGGNSATRWFYTALTNCEIYVMPKEDLRALFAGNSELTFYLMNWFSREVHEILTRLSSLGKTLARDKVAAALKFFAVRHCEERRGGWRRVKFPVSHQLIADMVGITRESATITMKDFQIERIIRTPRATTLEINYEKLRSA